MTIIEPNLEDQIMVDLLQATTDLADARVRRGLKDSPATRAVVVACQRDLDGLLDMLLDSLAAGPSRQAGLSHESEAGSRNAAAP
jgi:hypothetical protein